MQILNDAQLARAAVTAGVTPALVERAVLEGSRDLPPLTSDETRRLCDRWGIRYAPTKRARRGRPPSYPPYSYLESQGDR